MVRSVPFLFVTRTAKRPMSLLKSFCVICNLWMVRQTFIGIYFLCLIDVVEHRHEDDPIFEFFVSDSAFCHLCLNLFENFHCSVSWESIPLELTWPSLSNPNNSLYSLVLWKYSRCFFPLIHDRCLWMIFRRQSTESE